MTDIVPQISSALSGLRQEFNTIAHNLANISTPGFKRRCNSFSRSLAVQGTGTQEEVGGEINLTSAIDFTQGGVLETGRSLDFALVGRGFFVIETPDGPLYTRNGMLRLDSNGQIVDGMGRSVAGESGAITIPSNVGLSQIVVGNDGNISGGGTAIGRFRLVDFPEDEKELRAVGMNCFQAPPDVKPQAPKDLIVKQGFKETSNVQMVEELVDIMMVSKLYEANMQFISVKRDTSKSIIDVAMG